MLGLKGRARYWLCALGAGLLLALISLWRTRPRDAEPPLVLEQAPQSLHPASVASRAPASSPSAAASEAPARAPSAPIIDEIVVEKPAPCVGEETLVTVRAHTADDSDAELHYLIGTGTGQSVPVRAWVDERGQAPALQVTVFGKGNRATSAPVPLRVQPCHVGTFAVITHRALPNRWGSFAFRAELRQHQPGAPAKAATIGARRYRWTFGDGSTETTDAAEVTHSYEERPQQTLYSQFLVRVEVATRDGRTLVARDALQLANPAYESWTRKGIVSLMVALDPPFPILSDTGRVEQGVRLRHYSPDPVTIDSVKAVRYYANGAGESPPENVDVAALLGTASIPAGTGLELHVTLDPQAEPDVVSVSYYLKGKSADGHPVVGSFSVMRPPPAPTAENSTPVTDPQLAARIRRARERLGKSVVSDADLARLERQGAFKDL